MSKVTEILRRHFYYDDRRGGKLEFGEAEQAIMEWVNEVIGEDLDWNNGPLPDWVVTYEQIEGANKTKVEQRKRAGLDS